MGKCACCFLFFSGAILEYNVRDVMLRNAPAMYRFVKVSATVTILEMCFILRITLEENRDKFDRQCN